MCSSDPMDGASLLTKILLEAGRKLLVNEQG